MPEGEPEVVVYERDDEAFREPTYKKHPVQLMLYLLGLAAALSQISLTLNIIPGRFWYLPPFFFILAFASYIGTYIAMEYGREVRR